MATAKSGDEASSQAVACSQRLRWWLLRCGISGVPVSARMASDHIARKKWLAEYVAMATFFDRISRIRNEYVCSPLSNN